MIVFTRFGVRSSDSFLLLADLAGKFQLTINKTKVQINDISRLTEQLQKQIIQCCLYIRFNEKDHQ